MTFVFWFLVTLKKLKQKKYTFKKREKKVFHEIIFLFFTLMYGKQYLVGNLYSRQMHHLKEKTGSLRIPKPRTIFEFLKMQETSCKFRWEEEIFYEIILSLEKMVTESVMGTNWRFLSLFISHITVVVISPPFQRSSCSQEEQRTK